jgi:benzoyl-CoA 2,3-dioxygenase component A
VSASKPYSVTEQLGWESLPEELCADVLAAAQTTENAVDVQDLSQAQAVIAAAAGLADNAALRKSFAQPAMAPPRRPGLPPMPTPICMVPRLR